MPGAQDNWTYDPTQRFGGNPFQLQNWTTDLAVAQAKLLQGDPGPARAYAAALTPLEYNEWFSEAALTRAYDRLTTPKTDGNFITKQVRDFGDHGGLAFTVKAALAWMVGGAIAGEAGAGASGTESASAGASSAPLESSAFSGDALAAGGEGFGASYTEFAQMPAATPEVAASSWDIASGVKTVAGTIKDWLGPVATVMQIKNLSDANKARKNLPSIVPEYASFGTPVDPLNAIERTPAEAAKAADNQVLLYMLGAIFLIAGIFYFKRR